jgi:hypothetical protein
LQGWGNFVLPKLKKLDLQYARDVEALHGNFPHLTRLNLTACDLYDSQLVYDLVTNLHMPALEELDLSSSYLSLTGIAAMAEAGAGRRWPHLRSFTMGVPDRHCGVHGRENSHCWEDLMHNMVAVRVLMHSIGPELRCPSQEEDARAFAADDPEDPEEDPAWFEAMNNDCYCWKKE